MLVASAVLPIEGLPAKIIKSDLCNPLSFSSKSLSPVGTPTNFDRFAWLKLPFE